MMADNETRHRLLEKIAAVHGELAPPEREIFEALQAQLARGQAPTTEEVHTLEIILRNVEIRKKTGLKLHTPGNASTS
jgi:hypothetical protein